MNDYKDYTQSNDTILIRSKHQTAWRVFGAIISVTLFAFACYTLYGIIRNLNMGELRASLAALTQNQIIIAVSLTCFSYLMLTFYDALALKHIGAKSIGYGTTALASFTSYAISFTLGFPLLTAGAVRLWIYGNKGLSAPKIASLTVIAGLTFWLGMGIILGVSLMMRSHELANLNHLTPFMNSVIGTSIISLTIAYLIFALRPRRMNVQGWKLVLPGVKVTLGQIILGVADVCASGGVLYVLLPENSGIAFSIFIAAYVFGHILGLASHAPGGAGVFETTMLLALHQISSSTLFGAIILYRVFYYLVPFIFALVLLGIYEIKKRLKAFLSARFDDENENGAGV
jgi:glycosyltransferase 2 family protein